MWSREARDVDGVVDGVRFEEDVVQVAAAERPLSVVVPERGDDVGDDQLGGVGGDQSEHEHAVATQVRLGEHARRPPVALARRVVPVRHLHAHAALSNYLLAHSNYEVDK